MTWHTSERKGVENKWPDNFRGKNAPKTNDLMASEGKKCRQQITWLFQREKSADSKLLDTSDEKKCQKQRKKSDEIKLLDISDGKT